MDYTEAQEKLTKISRKKKRNFTQEDISLLNELKKHSLSKIKSWATQLLPNKQTKTQKVGRMFKRLGQGSSSTQYFLQTEKGLM